MSMHMTGEHDVTQEGANRGQSFGHAHTLSPPTRQQSQLTEHHSCPPSLPTIDNDRASTGMVKLLIAILVVGRSSETWQDTVSQMSLVGVLVYVSFPARHMYAPRHVAVVSDRDLSLSTAWMRSAKRGAGDTALRDLEPIPGSLGRIGKAAHRSRI